MYTMHATFIAEYSVGYSIQLQICLFNKGIAWEIIILKIWIKFWIISILKRVHME